MNFGLIIVGDEILSGKRQDKHLPKVIDLLAARGLSLSWARYVGDDPDRIAADLKDAFEGAARDGDIVFSCGGIGATPDDHTRQSAARALGRPLALHPEARDLIFQRMRDVAAEQGVPFEPDRDDNVHRLNMGVFPEGAEIIPNPYNRIAGFSVKAGDGGVWFVPGFPVMAATSNWASRARATGWPRPTVTCLTVCMIMVQSWAPSWCVEAGENAPKQCDSGGFQPSSERSARALTPIAPRGRASPAQSSVIDLRVWS